MSGSDWTQDEPDDRVEARPVTPPPGFEPSDEPAPSLARTPEPAAPRSDLGTEIPDEAPPSRLRGLIHAGLAIPLVDRQRRQVGAVIGFVGIEGVTREGVDSVFLPLGP